MGPIRLGRSANMESSTPNWAMLNRGRMAMSSSLANQLPVSAVSWRTSLRISSNRESLNSLYNAIAAPLSTAKIKKLTRKRGRWFLVQGLHDDDFLFDGDDEFLLRCDGMVPMSDAIAQQPPPTPVGPNRRRLLRCNGADKTAALDVGRNGGAPRRQRRISSNKRRASPPAAPRCLSNILLLYCVLP
jgi:hypothetical protein